MVGALSKVAVTRRTISDVGRAVRLHGKDFVVLRRMPNRTSLPKVELYFRPGVPRGMRGTSEGTTIHPLMVNWGRSAYL